MGPRSGRRQCAIRADPATLRCPGILGGAMRRADPRGARARERLDQPRRARKNDGARPTSLDDKASARIQYICRVEGLALGPREWPGECW
jgi:hypothetical protein